MNPILKVFALPCLLVYAQCYSQTQSESDKWKIERGDSMPNFALGNVTHYTKETVTLADFSGKWLVLDFWASFCVPCIASFPKMNKLQAQFGDKVKILMIGLIGRRAHADLETTRRMYERLRLRQDLNLTVAYDSNLARKLDIWSVPRVMVVDPHGIVRIANTNRIDSVSLASLIEGDSTGSYEYRSFSKRYEPNKLFDVGDPKYSQNLLFASILSRHDGEQTSWPPLKLTEDNNVCTFRALAAPLKVLYKYAYIGRPSWQQVRDSIYDKVYPNPILEMEDTTEFSYSWDPRNSYGLYNYSVYANQCADVDKEKLMEILQTDLKRYFGYVISIERRLMPCWKLVVTSEPHKRKLKTAGGPKMHPTATAAGFTLKNAPVSELLNILWNYHAGKEPPFIDETGISGNIDIEIDGLITDLSDLQRALNANGLNLVKGKRYMDVIVVRRK